MMNDKKSIVPVLVVNYNCSELIQQLLDSIEEPQLEVKILVLDNGSTDNSWERLHKLTDERLTALKSDINLGFTGGVNYLVRYVQLYMPEATYFFLLNPDAISLPGLIHELLKLVSAEENIAAISPKIVDLNNRSWYAGAEIDYKKGVVNNNPKREVFSGAIEVDVFSGCAALFNLRLFAMVGMFNERLFMYYDEADLSIRFKNSGFKIMYTERFQIQHDVSYTTRKMSHLKLYYMIRNKFMVFSETMSDWFKVYYVIWGILFYGRKFQFRNVQYFLKGVLHFLYKKDGHIKQ